MSRINRVNNVGRAARIVKNLGGTVVGVLPGSTKHIKLGAVTPQGNRLTITLSKGKSDPEALTNWIRQAINRADNRSNP